LLPVPKTERYHLSAWTSRHRFEGKLWGATEQFDQQKIAEVLAHHFAEKKCGGMLELP
jgi:hypothetical protein